MKYPEISKFTKVYWKDEDFKKLETSKTIHEVFNVANGVISRMPDVVSQVCGPITNGGKGSIEDNLNYLNYSIQKLQAEGVVIFDQMPFEETFHRIISEEAQQHKNVNVLTDFYEPLFGLNKIKTLYFVQGWESSRGANWEYEKAKELGIDIKLL